MSINILGISLSISLSIVASVSTVVASVTSIVSSSISSIIKLWFSLSLSLSIGVGGVRISSITISKMTSSIGQILWFSLWFSLSISLSIVACSHHSILYILHSSLFHILHNKTVVQPQLLSFHRCRWCKDIQHNHIQDGHNQDDVQHRSDTGVQPLVQLQPLSFHRRHMDEI